MSEKQKAEILLTSSPLLSLVVKSLPSNYHIIFFEKTTWRKVNDDWWSIPLTSRTNDPAKSKWTYSSQTGAWRPEKHLHVREDLDGALRWRTLALRVIFLLCHLLPDLTEDPEKRDGDSCEPRINLRLQPVTAAHRHCLAVLMLCKCNSCHF